MCGPLAAHSATGGQSGLTVATSSHNCLTIYVFTDLLRVIQNSTNVFRHSSQGVFLNICCKLSQWFDGAVRCQLFFVHTPLPLQWEVQGYTHKCAKGLSIFQGVQVCISVNAIRKMADKVAIAACSKLAILPGYIRLNFFQLEQTNRELLCPTTVKSGL